jgi:hypothetical protein
VGDLGVRGRRAGRWWWSTPSPGFRFRGLPGEFLPLGAELRAGDRVLCARTSLLGDDSQEAVQGIVLSCPTRQVPRLTVALGVGARILPLDAHLTP